MNPLNDFFLSTSRDKSTRLWDLNKRECLCIIQDSNCATFDNSGKILASVTSETNKITETTKNFINLYSLQNNDYLNGPFKVFKIEGKEEINQIKFSPDGSMILCSMNDNKIYIIDSFEGAEKKVLQGDINSTETIIKFDISADSRYVASGSEDGNILIWNIRTGELVQSLEAHPNMSYCVKFSPVHTLLASSCTNLILWHPSI